MHSKHWTHQLIKNTFVTGHKSRECNWLCPRNIFSLTVFGKTEASIILTLLTRLHFSVHHNYASVSDTLPCSCQQSLTRVVGGEQAAWQGLLVWGRREEGLCSLPGSEGWGVELLKGHKSCSSAVYFSSKSSLDVKHNTDPAREVTESRSTSLWELCFLQTKAELEMEKLWCDNGWILRTITEECGLWTCWTWVMWCENWRDTWGRLRDTSEGWKAEQLSIPSYSYPNLNYL